MDEYDDARCRLIEHAALMWTLNEVPEDPCQGFEQLSSDDRVLSFEKEKQLTEDFAFLASSSDDPLKVKAVCIEQDEENNLIVKVASNTLEPGLITGFQELFSILRSASVNGL